MCRMRWAAVRGQWKMHGVFVHGQVVTSSALGQKQLE